MDFTEWLDKLRLPLPPKVLCIFAILAMTLVSMTGCAHVKEHRVAYIAAGMVVTVALLQSDGVQVSTDPCADVPPYKERALALCRKHFP